MNFDRSCHCVFQGSRFQMILSNDGDVTYVFYNYDIGGMNFIHADPFIGFVAPGVLQREQNSLDGDYLRHPDVNLINSGKRLSEKANSPLTVHRFSHKMLCSV